MHSPHEVTDFTGYRWVTFAKATCGFLSAPHSHWQRAYVVGVIGSIRRECLDHVFVSHESSLRRTL